MATDTLLHEIRPRTHKQKFYLDSIHQNIITFAIGEAGTGKTLLATYAGLQQLFDRDSPIKKLILIRPAIHAGNEKLGFLPGDLESKLDPFMAPFFDAFEKIEKKQGLIDAALSKKKIEIATLAYMRGRSFSNAFVICDEAQNTDKENMKMLLTRIGEYTKYVLCGDPNQTDIPKNKINGLDDAFNRFANQPNFGSVYFGNSDIVRSKICQQIVEGYSKAL